MQQYQQHRPWDGSCPLPSNSDAKDTAGCELHTYESTMAGKGQVSLLVNQPSAPKRTIFFGLLVPACRENTFTYPLNIPD